MTTYLSLTPVERDAPAAAGRHRMPPVGKPRGWRYAGRHTRRRIARRLLGDAIAWVLLVLVASIGLASFGPKVAAASAGPPDDAPRLTVAEGEAHDVMAAAREWAALVEARDYARQYDGWSTSARALVSREAYLASLRCAPVPADVDRVVNVRVDHVTVYGRQAIAWYWGESFHHIGPVRMRAATFHLYELLSFEDGVWRHEPAEHLLGTLVDQVAVGAARCKGTGA